MNPDLAERLPVARHELAHALVAQLLGARVAGAEVGDDGSGRTLLLWPAYFTDAEMARCAAVVAGAGQFFDAGGLDDDRARVAASGLTWNQATVEAERLLRGVDMGVLEVLAEHLARRGRLDTYDLGEGLVDAARIAERHDTMLELGLIQRDVSEVERQRDRERVRELEVRARHVRKLREQAEEQWRFFRFCAVHDLLDAGESDLMGEVLDVERAAEAALAELRDLVLGDTEILARLLPPWTRPSLRLTDITRRRS